MKKILLDTNMFIYLEDNKVIDEKVATLTKRLYDSTEYKIVIHPKTKVEASKCTDVEIKKIFLSKISVYKEIKDPPLAPEEFHKLLRCKNIHDEIDNELLFSVNRNCVDYLITNDQDMLKKAKKINLDNRVLSIEKALEIFQEEEKLDLRTPVFITNEFLYNIDLNDTFFDSLRNDYLGFDDWFKKKQLQERKALVTKANGKIKSFLMMKIEDENEKYDDYLESFQPAKRLKISTFKVDDTGKRIGETFVKLIINQAIEEKVAEIYVTIFDKHKYLIEMLEDYGFKFKTKKRTYKSDGTVELENVLVKDMINKKEFYPFFSIKDKKVFIIPIKEEYHTLLFQDYEKYVQLSMEDLNGINTAANSLKKAYLCDSNTTKIEPGSIVLFYSSGIKKAITSLGIVDAVFNKFNTFEEMFSLVNKRTAYSETELKKFFKTNKLVILFKIYNYFKKEVPYSYLINNKIVNGPIQTVTEIQNDKLMEILNECQIEKDIFLVK